MSLRRADSVEVVSARQEIAEQKEANKGLREQLIVLQRESRALTEERELEGVKVEAALAEAKETIRAEEETRAAERPA